jgi:predicted nucleic acid-binding protein
VSYLLDTCVLSEYTKKNPNSQVIDWLDGQEEAGLLISILSIAEIRKGIIRITDSQPNRANKLRIWVEKLQTRFIDRILPLDEEILNSWAVICGKSEAKGVKLPIMDSLIAVTAYEYQLTIVTRNVTDFNFSTVKVFSPWGLDEKQ